MRKSQKSNRAVLNRLAVLSLCCVFVLGACATMPTQRPDDLYMRHRATLKLAVSIGVIEFLYRHPELATPVADIATAIHNEMGGQADDMGMLKVAMRRHMLALNIAAPEQLLLMNLADVLLQSMRIFFLEREVIPTQVRVRIGEIAGWVADTAAQQERP